MGRKEQLFAKALVCARYHVRPRIQARAVSKTVKLLLTWTPPRRQVGYTAPVCYSVAVPGTAWHREKEGCPGCMGRMGGYESRQQGQKDTGI